MESLLIPLGLLGLAAFIGGVVGFFSLFTADDKESRLKALEREAGQLRLELTKLNIRLETLKKSSTTTPDKTPSEAHVETPNLTEAHVLAENIGEDTLTQQVLATPIEEVPVQTASAEANKASAENQRAEKTFTQPAAHMTYAEPNVIERGLSTAKDWLLGGNTLVRSGIVILFIGVSFLIKYAAEHSHVPIELRLAGIALSGIGLLAFGWHLRERRAQYSWALQGGGIGIMYLTIFAALKLYQLIPTGLAFVLLIAIAVLSALIAVLQSAMPLAILGFTGGFLAPILASSEGGSHVGLFSYYLVLNLGIAFVAFHKSWRPLNVLGFAFTFVISTLWGVKSYTPAHFATTEPFLIIHFLLFTLIAVLYAHRQATKASDYVDATLVFGTPLVGFSLQYALLRDSHFGLAYSALCLGIFYMSLAWWVLTRQRATLKFLGECFLALGVGFITLTLPLALDGRWTSAAWAVEGVGLLWVGLRQQRALPAFTGLALQLLAAMAFSKGWGLTGYSEIGHQNMFLGVGFIALSGWACGALLNQYHTNRFAWLATPLAFWGWAWWVGAGLTAIDILLASRLFIHAGLMFVALTSLGLPFIARYLHWPALAKLATLLLPTMAMTVLVELFDDHHPFANIGAWAWGVSLAVYLFNLQRNHICQGSRYRAPLVWIAAIIGAWEWQYQFEHWVTESSVWYEIGYAIVPLLLLAGITQWLKHKADAFATGAARTWAWVACVPLAAFLVWWFMWMSLYSSGNAAPLPYVPLINPLDIVLMGTLLMLLIWQSYVGKAFNRLHTITPALAGVMSFTLLNGVLLRSLHHWAGTPFRWTAIFDTPLVQVVFTFLWGLSAFALMLLAQKMNAQGKETPLGDNRTQRQLWVIGASLMGLVVAKIFLLDMAQSGSVERIISFIGAGLMLLVMGYFAPLPPAKTLAAEEERT